MKYYECNECGNTFTSKEQHVSNCPICGSNLEHVNQISKEYYDALSIACADIED